MPYTVFHSTYAGRKIVIGSRCVSWFHDRAQRPCQSPQHQYVLCTWNHSTEPVGPSNTGIYVGACVFQANSVVQVQNRAACMIYFLDDCTNCRKENITS